MILTIDMGNSNIVVGGIDENKLYFEERITTDHRKTSLEYAIMLKNILEINKVKKSDIEGSIMSSVVPPLNAPLSSAVKKITGKKPMLVGSGMKTGINIKVDNPKSVGGDRIVAAVAAVAQFEGPIIVIDMGTATTLDVVDRSGSYTGGVILPGVMVSLNALVGNTAQLPQINLDAPKRVIGK
ncbi:MAG: type III pantothenate kinase, partial [Lachnospiraceae bacterium]|nr:type III pantothenate kinase [Lachnospiraceae bacterium]